ncbi:MAG: hypothetical protein U5N26_12435 [Candidatus Marinimicrobia bacterium]|nr:hypothetical protein [Candidatus Neomarinimicrobiota bacterium]
MVPGQCARESCADIKLYNREHYRWLCPSRKETEEYLRNRVAELAEIRGLAGVHLDFIRYPDAILPYGLHESRGVFQDKVYPRWDFCYCEVCREAFRERTGIDPLELEDSDLLRGLDAVPLGCLDGCCKCTRQRDPFPW